MDLPTSAQIRTWSKVDFGQLGFGEDTPDPLDRLISQAGGIFSQFTGRPIDSTYPTNLEAAGEAALQRMVELMAYQAQSDVIETVADFLLLQGFSAGSYSETRRSLNELKDSRLIVADPTLNGLFWSLLTPDQYDWWTAYFSGENVPAWEVTEVFWDSGVDPFHNWVPDGIAWPTRRGGW